MKIPKIAHAIGLIDSEIVEEAAEMPRRGLKIKRWAAAAACLAIVCTAVTLIKFADKGEPYGIGQVKLPQTILGSIDRDYKAGFVASEIGYVPALAWEDMDDSERYLYFTYGGGEYSNAGSKVDEAFIGSSMGYVTALGEDGITGEMHSGEFEAFILNGVSHELNIALLMDGEYFVFRNRDSALPETAGELMACAGLPETLKLGYFSLYDGDGKASYYTLRDDSYIWQVISEHKDAQVKEFDRTEELERISFSATSEPLGVYKRSFSIYENGYVYTNILDRGYCFDIGAETAKALIAYAKENSDPSEYIPHFYTLVGKVTKIDIEAEFIFIDDSELCTDPEQGIEFKVSTDGKVSTYIASDCISVGDYVAVDFPTDSVQIDGNSLGGAVSISVGHLDADSGNVLIPE